MNLDPRKSEDWEIAKAAEKKMVNIKKIASDLGFKEDEIISYGKDVLKIEYHKAFDRLKGNSKGKYIAVTAITPTIFGEGKTTTTIGLLDGLCKLGMKASAAIRQPSAGPTFNLKGSGGGGGLAQCIPLSKLSIGLTGDIDAITNAHNLSMVALTAQLQQEMNYSDEKLEKLSLRKLNIDPQNLRQKWVMDYCTAALRDVDMHIKRKEDFENVVSGFNISAASEIMAILSQAVDLKDLREKIGEIVLAISKDKKDITTKDLKVDGAMAAWLVEAFKPNLMQSIENNPIFVHGGPFANISIGQSSIIADKLGLTVSDYHITESGFGSDIGFEKFCDIKCKRSNEKPDVAVIVATIRALKMHGGGEEVKKNKSLPNCYLKEDLPLVEKGIENLLAHIDIVKKFNVTPVVCLNFFESDTEKEIALVKKAAEDKKAFFAVSKHWLLGGEGAIDLAKCVLEVSEKTNEFKFLYNSKDNLRTKIEKIAFEIYGAKNVIFKEKAKEKIDLYENDQTVKEFDICIAKTPLSLSHDLNLKGRPQGYDFLIDDILIYKGAGLIVPIAGKIVLMPGTVAKARYKNIDIDVSNGDIKGVF